MPAYDLSPTPAHPAHGPTVVGDLPCTGCGYNLAGIPISKVCPECGRPVELSLRGELLRFAAPAYLAAVDLGLAVILTAIFLYVLLLICQVPLAMIGPGTFGTAGVQIIIAGTMFLCDCVFIFGYWKFTQPDPGYTGREKPNSSRSVARIAACTSAAANLGRFLIKVLGTLSSASPMLVGLFDDVFKYAAWAAWATLFFAMILYTGHLARRIPDRALIAQTRTYIWLLPLLFVVGAVVFCLGPLIALILYATMLQTLRARTREIVDWQRRGGRHVFGA